MNNHTLLSVGNSPGWVESIAVHNGHTYFTNYNDKTYSNLYVTENGKHHAVLSVPNSKLRTVISLNQNTLLLADYQNHKILSYSTDCGRLDVLAGTGENGNQEGGFNVGNDIGQEWRFVCDRLSPLEKSLLC